MRALVTGANGFVGRYLQNHLAARGYDVVAAGRSGEGTELSLELLDAQSVSHAVEAAAPDVVFHLGAQTFVPAASEDPIATYRTNVMGTAYLVQSLRAYRDRSGKNPRMINVSSAQVYGQADAVHGPLKESDPVRPIEPYAASKAAAEHITAAAHHTFGLDVITARAFNHIGVGQDERFVVSAFAWKLARIAAGRDKALLEVGNLEAERDFLDVRDVVEGYISIAEHGTSGEVYNVCGGNPLKIKMILRLLILQANTPVEVREDPEKMRPVDVPQFYGDNTKLRMLGWSPRISIEASLKDIYESTLRQIVSTV